jgi:hypothetical protein
MNRIASAAFAAAMASLAASPALAADDIHGGSQMERRSGAFAGASFRIPIGGRDGGKSSARLQLTMEQRYTDPQRGFAGRTIRTSGIEFGASPSGRASFYVGGQSLPDLERRMRMTGSTGWVIGGIAIAVVGLAVVGTLLDNDTNAQPQPAPPAQ